MNNRLFTLLFLLMSFFLTCALSAGNFITEVPEPTEYEHIEYIPYVAETKIKSWSLFSGPAAEINIGILPDVQGHIIVPILLFSPRNGKQAYGLGDIELGTKYRFIPETEMMPQIAFYPKVTLPSGDSDLGLGWGVSTQSIPLWIEKNWGPWKLSGGGGYTFIQALDTADYLFGGALLQREIMESLTLGGELYAQGTINANIRSTLIFTFGGSYNFTKNFSLPFSVGHSLAGQKTLMGYIGFDWVWGARS